MYVKVSAADLANADFLTEVSQPLHSGSAVVALGGNAKWDDDGRLRSPGDVDFSKALRASVEYIHVLEFTGFRSHCETDEAGNTLMPFRYAWWEDMAKGLTAIVTTRPIFILGDNGKTIDKV